jgi:hypothetical protein
MTFPDDLQKAIVTLDSRTRARVTAGPGSGKTEVAASRLLHLIECGVKPQQISVLSFSRAAVANFNRRLARMTMDEWLKNELRLVSVRTFDSFAFNLLRYAGYDGGRLLRKTHDENIIEATKVIKQSSAVPEHLEAKKHFFIDEFQDLPSVRGEFVYELLRKLSVSDDFGFTLLGDPAQAIFAFADDNRAQNDWWDRIGNDLCHGDHLYELNRNYRAEPVLGEFIEFFHQQFSNHRVQPEQLLQAAQEMLKKFTASNDLPAESSQAILTRTNGDVLNLHKIWFGQEEEPRTPHPNFITRDGKVSPPPWIARILQNCTSSLVSFPEIEHWRSTAIDSKRFPDKEFLEKILFLSGAVENKQLNLPLFRSRLSWPHIWPDDLNIRGSGAVFSTIHQSKGLEFEKVTLLVGGGIRDGLTREQAREESSVLFVAFSRAKSDISSFALNGYQYQLYERDFGKLVGSRWASPQNNSHVHFEVKSQDVSPNSFVSRGLFKTDEGVLDLQNFLWEKRDWLIGRKVVLVRHFDDSTLKHRFFIYLQENNEPTRLLGEMNIGEPGVPFGLLVHNLKGSKGKWPNRIYNLRISSVESFAISGEFNSDIAAPWNNSGIWLGVRLQGLGFFKRF